MSPNPTLWLSVTSLNLCLCLEYRSGSSACHLRKDYKGQLKQGRSVWIFFFSSGFSALRLIFICYWFKSIPRGPASPVSSPAPVRFLLKIALLLAQIPLSDSLSAAHLKIDTSLWKLNLWVSKTPGRTPERFGFRDIEPFWCVLRWCVLMWQYGSRWKPKRMAREICLI